MKSVLVAAVVFSSLLASAQTAPKCAAQAEGMAQMKYLDNNPGIQGHEYSVLMSDYKVDKSDNSAAVEITIDGKNDEGDTWTEKYKLLVALDNCILAQIRRLR